MNDQINDETNSQSSDFFTGLAPSMPAIGLIHLINGRTIKLENFSHISPQFRFIEVPEFTEVNGDFQVRTRREVQVGFYLYTTIEGEEPSRLSVHTVELQDEVASLEESSVWAAMEKNDKSNVSERIVKMKNYLRSIQPRPVMVQNSVQQAVGQTVIGDAGAAPQQVQYEVPVLDEEKQKRYVNRFKFCTRTIAKLARVEKLKDLNKVVDFLAKSHRGEDTEILAADVQQIRDVLANSAALNIVTTL